MYKKILNRVRAALLTSTLCLITPNIAYAHHAAAPHFDLEKKISVDGVFTKLKLANPHTYIYFDVTENGETQNWRCELMSASLLKRLGWTKETFEPGQSFTMNGSPARREGNVCVTDNITLPSGRVLDRNTNIAGQTYMKIEGDSHLLREDEKLDFTDREKYLPNGQLNISGNWRSINFARGSKYHKPFDKAESFDVTPAGKEANKGYNRAKDDPALRCHYTNHIWAWGHDAIVNKIEQTDDAVILNYGYMDKTRTVHLNQDSHPENLTPSDTGYSIGRWEDDTLIVETTGFEPGVLSHIASIMHSDQLYSVERFYIDPKLNFLMRETVVTDPVFLNAPKTFSDGQELVSLPFEKYDCALEGADHLSNASANSSGPKIQTPKIEAPKVEVPKIDTPAKGGGGKWLFILLALAALILGGGFLARRKKG